MSHKKSKIPHALIQTRIQQGIKKQGDADYKLGYEAGQKDLQMNANESDQVQQLQQNVASLTRLLKQSESNLQTVRQEYVIGVASTVNNDFLVQNWRASWKWISNWCFGLIVFFATTPIPPELLAVLPENIRVYVIAWIAFCGFAGRYLNQSKGVQSWSLKS